jgi:hypothetical protein
MIVTEDKHVSDEDQAYKHSQKDILTQKQARWPGLMDERTAAEYVSFSMSYLRNLRHTDGQRMLAGLGPLGPPFVKINRTIRYKYSDLDAWIDAQSREVNCDG